MANGDTKPLVMYKDNRQINVSPDAYDEAYDKGWRLNKPQGVLSRTLGYIGQGLNPQGMLGTLEKFSAPNMMKQAYQHFTDPKGHPQMLGDTASAIKGLVGGLPTAPKIASDLIQRKDPAQDIAGMAMMMSPDVGEAGIRGVGKGMEPEANAILEHAKNTFERGSYRDVMAELENFRRTMKAKPSPKMMDVARGAHEALGKRVDAEWNSVYSKMGAEPTDADAVERSLKELRKVNKPTEDWIQEHIEPSKSGESVTAPLFSEVRKLISRLQRMKVNPKVDPVVANELPGAIKGLEKATEDAAKRQGVFDKYVRAKRLTRQLENIKYHTAYNTRLIKPSPMYSIGGAVAGMATLSKEGWGAGFGGAYVGNKVGAEVGKWMTPKNTYTVPERSIAGEGFVWKKLGEEPPKGSMKSTTKPAEAGGRVMRPKIRQGESSVEFERRGPGAAPKPDELSAKLKREAQPGRDTDLLHQVTSEHPHWTLSQRLQEAAKRAKKSGQ